MRLKKMRTRSLVLAGWVVCLPMLATPALPDHQEFDAALQVPFRAEAARSIVMHFEYPGAAAGTPLAWQVSLLDRSGQPLREWNGSAVMHTRNATASVHWDGLDSHWRPLPAGYYTVRLRAIALDDDNARRIGTGMAAHALALDTRLAPTHVEEQRYDIQVGRLVATAMPAFNALPQHGGYARYPPGLVD